MVKGSFHSAFWLTLKKFLKKSRTCMFLVYRLRGVRFVDTLEELDRLLQDISLRYPVFNDGAIAESSKICYRWRDLKLPSDEGSVEYASKQVDLYQYLSGKNKHDLNRRDSEPEAEGNRKCSGLQDETSSATDGRHLTLARQIIRDMNLPPSSRIVELGAGCGDVTRELAEAGYRVTAVEVNRSYAERMQSQMKQSRGNVRIINQDMLDFVRNSSEEFDAALFVASFHHCLEHVELLRHLSERIAREGILCFADEPVFLAENPFLPYPWGIRLDGQSLYFMRRYGWLELGFQDAYLRRVLSQLGWKMERRAVGVKASADIIVASREHRRTLNESG
jgi:SAM-dependent methyltransferase